MRIVPVAGRDSMPPNLHGAHGTFESGFRIEPHQKDPDLALSSARAVRLLLSNTATAQELFNNCAAHGGKAWDHSALVRALDMMANDDIGAPVPE